MPEPRPIERLEYLTGEQVAALLQVSAKSVYRWAAADPSMPVLKLQGVVRFPRERLMRWLRDQEQGPARSQRMPEQERAPRKAAPPQAADATAAGMCQVVSHAGRESSGARPPGSPALPLAEARRRLGARRRAAAGSSAPGGRALSLESSALGTAGGGASDCPLVEHGKDGAEAGRKGAG